MLAKESAAAFNNHDWLFEIKWDGYRAISEIKNGVVELYSRNGISFNTTYPIVYNQLKKIKHQVIFDGEIVVINDEGKSDFQKLQHYEDNTQFPLRYYVFDLLSLNGEDTTTLPLIKRKKLLKKIIQKNPVIKYSEHIVTNGVDFFNAAKDNNLEGIMAKKINSQYHKGARTSEWLKIKYHKTEEVVIAGFTKPAGSRDYFGALVLAVKSKEGLKYAGHTGSGFTDKMLKEVYEKLKPLITNNSAFKEIVKTNMPVTWVKPNYVCEIKFTEWTTDGKMRHPIFLRMREDKTIKDIVMVTKKNTVKTDGKLTGNSMENDGELVIGKTKIKLTNRNKIYFPDVKITKGMVIDYYQQMSDYILPYLKGRPESLKRNPGGINDKGFFHKDAGEGAPAYVKSIKIFSESAHKEIDYILCNDKATLAYLNNLGCIEINPWNSTVKNLDKPDYMIIDIDPSEKNNFEQVIETANAFKLILDRGGADSFCKTSGATGLHIYVPMGKKYFYEQVKDFAQFLCMLVNGQLPLFTTMERNLTKRGNKNIYLDYLQNRRGQTIAAAYSLRPHTGATVSTPLLWKEVKSGFLPSAFNISTVPERVKNIGDIFKGVLQKGTDIKKCLTKIEADDL
ncbi:MAG: DNA ligase D [Ferruginibacter sp.]|nr:DNA ligase D [Ferruginibacter sp.]